MSISKFLATVNKMKAIRRSGWVEREVDDPESVADHSFMTTLLSYVLGRGKDMDMEKLLKMATIHDIAESVVGDIMTWKRDGKYPEGNKSPEEKYGIERKGLEELLRNLNQDIRDEITGLWLEFEEQKSPEAVFLKQIDKLEMLLQVVEYHRTGNFKKPLEPFFKNVELIKDPDLRKILKDIEELNEYDTATER
jgi:putative hydrolase of HD superfamily